MSNGVSPGYCRLPMPRGRSAKLKVVLLGAAGVGKSSLFKRIVTNEFDAHESATMGAALATVKVLERPDGRLVLLRAKADADARYESGTTWTVDIWDTAGQERYHALVPMYYRAANAVIIVHDNDPDAVAAARMYGHEIRHAGGGADRIVCLVHNKCDAPGFAYNQQLVDELQPDHAWFTSALTGENIEATFLETCRLAIETMATLTVLADPDEAGFGREERAPRCCV